MECQLQEYLKKTSIYNILVSALNNDLIRGDFEGKQALVEQQFLNILEEHVLTTGTTLSVLLKHIDAPDEFYMQQVLGMLRFHAENATINKVPIGVLDLIATEKDGVIPEEQEESETVSSEAI